MMIEDQIRAEEVVMLEEKEATGMHTTVEGSSVVVEGEEAGATGMMTGATATQM